MSDKLIINSNIRDYEVFFEQNLSFIDEFSRQENTFFVVDRNIFELYKSEFKAINSQNIFLFDAIEENKTFNSVFALYDFLLSVKFKRNYTLVSVGGGITQDITGFVASTMFRGLNWIFIPTTFLAITDSCVGSKTSLNYDKYKNLIGTFYPPSKIYINVSFLKTLSKIDFYSGIGETIKFQLMKSGEKNFDNIVKKILNLIDPNSDRLSIIYENLAIKQSYMAGDEFDLGRRNLLNYGHCFGHALETSSNYYVPHGIAVTIGIIFANHVSFQRGYLDKNLLDYLNSELLLKCIPLELRKEHLDSEVLLLAMKNDKKRVGEFLTLVMVDEKFELIKSTDISEEEFYLALEFVTKLLVKD